MIARGNRLSQQLALRLTDGASRTRGAAADSADYSIMRADTIEIETSNPAVGRIVSQGRLLDQKERLLAR